MGLKVFSKHYHTVSSFVLTQPIISFYQMQSLWNPGCNPTSAPCWDTTQNCGKIEKNICAHPSPLAPKRQRAELQPLDHQCEVLTRVDKLLDLWVEIKDRSFYALLPPPSQLCRLRHCVRLSGMYTVVTEKSMAPHSSILAWKIS